jgi:hypothetical protein
MPTFTAEFTGTMTMVCDNLSGVLETLQKEVCENPHIDLDSVVILKK